jgi:hypothetical protein
MTAPAAVGNLTGGHLPYRTTTGAAISGSNSTGGKLWLPIWSGEVIHAYDEYNMFENLVTTRVIPSGTTVEIPITGTVDLKPAWEAGEELVGGAASTAKTFQLKLDKRPMAAHFEVDNIDLMQTQWEYRNELARQAAQTIANARDKQIFSYLVRTATASQLSGDPRPTMNLESVLYGDTGEKQIAEWGDSDEEAADRATGALSALEYVEQFIVHLQENNIPYDRLYMAVTPQAFMDIRALGVARASDEFANGGQQLYFAGNAGLGGPLTNSYGQLHDTLEYMGCTIVKSNHVLGTDLSGGTTLGEDKYNLDFAAGGVKAVMWTPECMAGIRLQGLKVDTVDDIRRNTTFTVASMMAGTGVLRPECAALITSVDTSASAVDTRTEIRGSSYLDVDADGWAVA